MIETEYSAIETDDLVEFVLADQNATTREVELAQRLMLAIDMLAEHHNSEELGLCSDPTGYIPNNGFDA